MMAHQFQIVCLQQASGASHSCNRNSLSGRRSLRRYRHGIGRGIIQPSTSQPPYIARLSIIFLRHLASQGCSQIRACRRERIVIRMKLHPHIFLLPPGQYIPVCPTGRTKRHAGHRLCDGIKTFSMLNMVNIMSAALKPARTMWALQSQSRSPRNP